jgi:hypothetical protein
MNQIIARATVEDIVRHRNQALELYSEAFEQIRLADIKIKEAKRVASLASPGINGYNYSQAKEVEAFHKAVDLPDADQYMRVARRLVDINVWSYVIERTDLERLMDKEAKDKLHEQFRYVPERTDRKGEIINQDEIDKGIPEVSVENIQATVESFALQADEIFKRGIANAFSKLDRRFKSHDGFKIGSRIILQRVFDEWGHMSYASRMRDTLIDVERAFTIVDKGLTDHSYTEAMRALEHDRRGFSGARQSEIETEYFLIRGYKNGNAHLWFKRDDLVEKINKILADYYGEVIADGNQAQEDIFANIKTTPARFYGFYPTPEPAADFLFDGLPLYIGREDKPLRIMEPSAGTGNLARRLVKRREGSESQGWGKDPIKYTYQHKVDCVEIQPHLADQLEAHGAFNRVYKCDFLSLTPEDTGLYDVIAMNPPFDRERDIDHVVHAFKFLKPGGTLKAIMSAGTEFRETKKAKAFRELVEANRGEWRDLPPGSFSEVGTNVNTLIVKMRKPG